MTRRPTADEQQEVKLEVALTWADSSRIGVVGGPGGAYEKIKALAAEVRRLQEVKGLLAELHALVWGECPSLLNEDSGGDARLDLRIRAIADGAAVVVPAASPVGEQDAEDALQFYKCNVCSWRGTADQRSFKQTATPACGRCWNVDISPCAAIHERESK